MPPRRTLVIPMHQESARIRDTLADLAQARELLGDIELVLVDDGSTDGTAAVAEEAMARHGFDGRVLRVDRNGGKGAAIAVGMRAAAGDSVAFTDADLAAAPDAIARCFAIVEAGEADVVVTSRHLPGSEVTVRQPLARRSSSAAFRKLSRWAGLGSVSDSQCGLKAFTNDAAAVLFRGLSVQRFAFDVEVLLRAELAGLRVVEVPIRWRHVDASSVRTMRDGARMVLDVVRLRGRLRGWTPHGDMPTAAVLEREHWWYVAGREAAFAAARRAGARGPAIDVECGTGALVEAAPREGFEPAAGTTTSAGGGRFATQRKLAVASAATTSLPHPDACVGTVFALDVLQRVDDAAALREAARVLAPAGVVVVTVPANPEAWTPYDTAFGHRRRYTPETLRERLRTAGFADVRVERFHAWLSPVSYVLARTPIGALLLRDPEKSSFVHLRINAVLRVVVEIERRVRARVSLPFGQALVASGRKPA